MDPDRIGVTGGSAGGHLALMVGLAKEQVQASSAMEDEELDASLAAIVAYFPPVDFRLEETAVSGIISEVSQDELFSRFPALTFEEELIPAMSHNTCRFHGSSDSVNTWGRRPTGSHQSLYCHERKFNATGVESDFVTIEVGNMGSQRECV